MTKIVLDYLTRPMDVDKRMELVRTMRAQAGQVANREIAEREIKRLERERINTLTQHREGWINDDEAKETMGRIDAEIARWQATPEATPMPEHVRDGWAVFRESWANADLRGQMVLISEIIETVYVDWTEERSDEGTLMKPSPSIVGFRPTPAYADYFAVDPDGMVDVDWIAWAFGDQPMPTWATLPVETTPHRGLRERIAKAKGLQEPG